jgi:hypothetical protein
VGKFTGLVRISQNFDDASKKLGQVFVRYTRSQKVNMTVVDSGLQEILVHEFMIAAVSSGE